MEIDLYTDLAAFNALTPEEQQEEAERLRAALVQPEPPPKPPPRPPMARVMVAPAAAFTGHVMADTPGSVILRAEDILPEEEEPEPEPEPELKAELIPEPGPELRAELIPVPEPELRAVPVPELIAEPQPVGRPPESTGRKVKMDDQLKITGPLIDPGIPKSDSGLIVCPVCNSRSNPQDLFCIGCGSFLNEPDTPDVEVIETPSCSDCGAAVEPGEIFCPSCGSALPS
jgi:hypothetical protein